ncbi:single-stranded DNA-binding protein [Clostridium estertheticum]|uniref:single-stranded DNA-binding protein n=1 Tax=Clostridium estertheticum TaxID=238834 RepID=UPI001C0AC358|nr:single-stranded DNA-binding protein [Clostridium estertheticum]MBU3173305.1 single-stranded DNA-binding protein [Clostridium estertheticum]
MAVTEIGRLCNEVIVRKIKEDKKVLNNRMAIKVGKDKTTFIDIEAWNGTAELIGKHFKKGYEILVEGTLINKTGKKNEEEFQTVALRVEQIKFTNGNPKESNEDVPDFLK